MKRFVRLALWIPDMNYLRGMSGPPPEEPSAYTRKNRWTWRNPIKRIKELIQRRSFEEMIVQLEEFWSDTFGVQKKGKAEQEKVDADWDNLALRALDHAEDFWDVGRIYAYSRERSTPRMIAFEAELKNKGGWSAPYQR